METLHVQIVMEVAELAVASFVAKRGSGDHINSISIKEQIDNYFKSYRSERANKFIVYFQNFTNTYDSIDNLKIKYDTALSSNKKDSWIRNSH